MSIYVIILDSEKDHPNFHVYRRVSNDPNEFITQPWYNPNSSGTYSKIGYSRQWIQSLNVTSTQTGTVASAAIYKLT